jgi:uncharacterized membrane protein YhaH (DUF805 family)
MNAFYNFHGTSNRFSFMMTLIIGVISYFFLENYFNLYINSWALLTLIAITFLPAFVRRLKDVGIYWKWFLLLPVSYFLLGLSIFIFLNFIPEGVVSKNPILVSSLLIFIPSLIVSILIYWGVRQEFIRIFLMLTPVLSQFWLIYSLIFKRSESPLEVEIRVIKKLKTIYLTAEGRLTRGGFWLYGIVPMLILTILFSSIYLEYILTDYEYIDYIKGVGLFLSIGILIPFFVLIIKRLHDLDKSMWWLLMLLIPVFGGIYLVFITAFLRGDKDNGYGTKCESEDSYLVYQGVSKLLGGLIERFLSKKILYISLFIMVAVFVLSIYTFFDPLLFKQSTYIEYLVFDFLMFLCSLIICLYVVNNKIKINLGVSVIFIAVSACIVFFTTHVNDKNLIFYVSLVFRIAFNLFLIAIILLYARIKNVSDSLVILGLIIAANVVFYFTSKMCSVYYFYELYKNIGYEDNLILTVLYLNITQSASLFIVSVYLVWVLISKESSTYSLTSNPQ